MSFNYRYDVNSFIPNFNNTNYANNKQEKENQSNNSLLNSNNVTDSFSYDPDSMTAEEALIEKYKDIEFSLKQMSDQEDTLLELGAYIDSDGFMILDNEKYEAVDNGLNSFFMKTNEDGSTDYLKVFDNVTDNTSTIAKTTVGADGNSSTNIYNDLSSQKESILSSNNLYDTLTYDTNTKTITDVLTDSENRSGLYSTMDIDFQQSTLSTLGAYIDSDGFMIIDNEQYEIVDNGEDGYFKKTNSDGSTDYLKVILNQMDNSYKIAVTNVNLNGESLTNIYSPSSNINVNNSVEIANQGALADCWLIASLNALDTSENGRNLIRDTIKTNDDNTYTISLKGVDKEYTISNKELIDKKSLDNHSYGDDDVLLIELAMGKLFEDAQNGNVTLPEGINPTLSGGNLEKLMMILNGGETNSACNYSHPAFDPDISNGDTEVIEGRKYQAENNTLESDLESVYNKIQNNPDKYVANIGFATLSDGKSAIIKDVNGNDVVLVQGNNDLQSNKEADIAGHMWSIKSVDGENITMINPVFSGIEVVAPKSELQKYLAEIEYYEFT